MITVYLHGDLGDYFIPQIELMVSSVQEVLSAIKANFREFTKYLFEAARLGVNYHIRVGNQEIDEKLLPCPISSKVRSIHITPIPAGAGSTAKIIAGAALLGTGIGLMAVGLTTVIGISSSSIALMGGSLLLGGISSLFGKKKEEDRQSQSFNPSATTKEGGRVPIIYGVVLVGMYIVSADVKTYYQSA